MPRPGEKITHFCREYAVRGIGMFPLDMLRYDNAVPASEEDSNAICNKELRTINLRCYAREVNRGPHTARWESFGWRVLDDKK